MFQVNEYKIVFRRRWHLRTSDYGNGRYDTVCEIYKIGLEESSSEPSFTGVAKLHPNDSVDRIVGKKLALKRALDAMLPSDEQRYGEILSNYYERQFKNKAERTAIWKAFWTWVASWPNQPSNADKKIMEAINIIGSGSTIGGIKSPDAIRGDRNKQ